MPIIITDDGSPSKPNKKSPRIPLSGQAIDDSLEKTLPKVTKDSIYTTSDSTNARNQRYRMRSSSSTISTSTLHSRSEARDARNEQCDCEILGYENDTLKHRLKRKDDELKKMERSNAEVKAMLENLRQQAYIYHNTTLNQQIHVNSELRDQNLKLAAELKAYKEMQKPASASLNHLSSRKRTADGTVVDQTNKRIKFSSSSTASQLHDMVRCAPKHLGEESIFKLNSDNTKKALRPAEYLGLPPQIGRRVSDSYNIADNYIMREAGAGGLINPVQFKQSEQGSIGLTKEGLGSAKLHRQHPSREHLINKWRDTKDVEMSTTVRTEMEKAGFFKYGHNSLLPLRTALQNGGIMKVRDLIEALWVVDMETKPIRLELEVQWETRNICDAKDTLPFLCAEYGSGRTLAQDLRLLGSSDDFLQAVKRVLESYDRLAVLAQLHQNVTDDSKLPDCYVSVPSKE